MFYSNSHKKDINMNKSIFLIIQEMTTVLSIEQLQVLQKSLIRNLVNEMPIEQVNLVHGNCDFMHFLTKKYCDFMHNQCY